MRLSLFVGAALMLATFVATADAGAFTFENQDANNGDGTPRFTDPDARGEKATDPSGSSTVFFGGRAASPDRYGYDPTIEARPLPRAAQIGAGDHGFNNSSRYGNR